jgi:hypothetical protein
MVAQTIVECDFRKFDHPTDSKDLVSCEFFLVGDLHEKMTRSVYETMNEFEKKVKVVIQAILTSRLITIY